MQWFAIDSLLFKETPKQTILKQKACAESKNKTCNRSNTLCLYPLCANWPTSPGCWVAALRNGYHCSAQQAQTQVLLIPFCHSSRKNFPKTLLLFITRIQCTYTCVLHTQRFLAVLIPSQWSHLDCCHLLQHGQTHPWFPAWKITEIYARVLIFLSLKSITKLQ